MDYKELIEELRMVASWKCSDCYDCNQCIKAANAIETLLAERDAAVEMLRGECHACKQNTGWHNTGKCVGCVHETAPMNLPGLKKTDNWEWRGPQSGEET